MKYNKFWTLIISFLSITLLFSCQQQTDSSSLGIENMKCEYLNNPLGIDVLSPRLSWQIKARRNSSEKQTTYRIIVASSRDKLIEGKADLWDTGKVKSDQSTHVAYKGKTLQSQMHCLQLPLVCAEGVGCPSFLTTLSNN